MSKNSLNPIGQEPKKPNIFVRSINKVLSILQNFVVFVDNFVNFMIDRKQENVSEVVSFTQRPIRIGSYIIIIFVIGCGTWAATAPLDSATTAIGTVMYSGHKKVVQFQDTGTVKDILVKIGDYVNKDDIIMKMDDTRYSSKFLQVQSEYRMFLAREARLSAEKDGLDEIKWPELLISDRDNNIYRSEIDELIRTQTNTFLAKKASFKSFSEIQESKSTQLKETISGYNDRIKALQSNIAIFTETSNSLNKLLAQGSVDKSKASDAMVRKIETETQLQETISKLNSAKEQILEIEKQIISQKDRELNETLKELSEVQNNLAKARESYREAKDSLEKTIVRATASGVINELGTYTIGSVIGQGTILAEISPKNEGPLRIEAKIMTKDITNIAEGQKVKIKFSAFNSRTSPTFLGKVKTITEDSTTDKNKAPAPGQDPSYYLAIIDIDFDSFKGYEKELESLRPGLQAEVGIVYGTRTLLSFLLTQLSNQMFRSLNER